nr:MAG TPA: hypothetical protein [Caudoviricetes sp.]
MLTGWCNQRKLLICVAEPAVPARSSGWQFRLR